jgi:hypothetical protein
LKGDTVSHQRSQFVWRRDHPTGRPGDASGDWVLTVMRGRDGKDGKDATAPNEDAA